MLQIYLLIVFTYSTVSVWNSNAYGARIGDEELTKCQLQVPTFVSEIGNGHMSKIISIHSLIKTSDNISNYDTFRPDTTNQVCIIMLIILVSKTNRTENKDLLLPMF